MSEGLSGIISVFLAHLQQESPFQSFHFDHCLFLLSILFLETKYHQQVSLMISQHNDYLLVHLSEIIFWKKYKIYFYLYHV